MGLGWLPRDHELKNHALHSSIHCSKHWAKQSPQMLQVYKRQQASGKTLVHRWTARKGSVNSLGFNDAGFFINYKWLLSVEDERKKPQK